jgi:hypothetical protein
VSHIAVENCTLLLSAPAVELAPPTILPPSVKVKADGKGVYRGAVTFTYGVGAISHPAWTASVTNLAPAIFTINGSATKVKADGQAVLLEGDESAQVLVQGQAMVGTTPTPSPQAISLKVLLAGQFKVSGE